MTRTNQLKKVEKWEKKTQVLENGNKEKSVQSNQSLRGYKQKRKKTEK